MKHFAAMLALGLALSAHAGIEEGVQAYAIGEYDKAIAEFKPLAEKGDPSAQYYMGFLYHHGYGVKRDEAEASKWFGMAAEQGDPKSQYYLGVIYEKGQGIPKDLVAAHMWLSLSAANPQSSHRDSLYTKEALDKLEKKMNEQQLAQAKEMATNWKSKN